MRNVNSCGIGRFKEALESFVSKVPDEPKTDGLTPGATDLISGRGRPTPWSTSSVQGGERPRTPPTSTLAKAPSYQKCDGTCPKRILLFECGQGPDFCILT